MLLAVLPMLCAVGCKCPHEERIDQLEENVRIVYIYGAEAANPTDWQKDVRNHQKNRQELQRKSQ